MTIAEVPGPRARIVAGDRDLHARCGLDPELVVERDPVVEVAGAGVVGPAGVEPVPEKADEVGVIPRLAVNASMSVTAR